MDHLSYPSPIYTSSMAAEPNFHHNTKENSNTQSPTSVFAVAELNNVFRAPDNRSSSEVVGDREKENRPFAPSLICSFATDGELSTFSEDTEEEGDGDNEDNAIIFRPRFALQRRGKSSQFIFRSASDEHDNSPTKKKRRFSAPPLCRANDIGSCDDDDTCDATSDLPAILLTSPPYSFASSFKNVCQDSSYISQTNTSSFTSLFAANAAASGITSSSVPVEATVDAVDRSTSPFSIMPRQLTHPLFLEALPILRATPITSADDFVEN